MARAQKPDFVFRLNGRVHLNRWGSQFSWPLAAEVCASALVMLDTSRSEGVWEYWLPTPFASFPFTSPPVRRRVPPHSERIILITNATVLGWALRTRICPCSWIEYCLTWWEDKTVITLVQKGENKSIRDVCGGVNESVIGYKPKNQCGNLNSSTRHVSDVDCTFG